MITVISDWVLLKHESKPVINPPWWGLYQSYGAFRPNLANGEMQSRQLNSMPSFLLLVLFHCAVINKDIYNQYFLNERSVPPTWIGWILESLAIFQSSIRLNYAQGRIRWDQFLTGSKEVWPAPSFKWMESKFWSDRAFSHVYKLQLSKCDAFLSVECE